MHQSSFNKVARLATAYLQNYRDAKLSIIDVGSKTVSQQSLSYRPLFDLPNWTYTGLDISNGFNVDTVLSDPYLWVEIPTESVDVVVSGQALEHIPFIWLTFFEFGRVLKRGGLGIVVAPSSGGLHRFPVDSWRIFEDGMRALAQFSSLDVLDVFTDHGNGDWSDSILVFQKPDRDIDQGVSFKMRHQALFQSSPRPYPIHQISWERQPISLLSTLTSQHISVEFEDERRKAVGKVFPTKERLRRAIMELIGQYAIERISEKLAYRNKPRPVESD